MTDYRRRPVPLLAYQFIGEDLVASHFRYQTRLPQGLSPPFYRCVCPRRTGSKREATFHPLIDAFSWTLCGGGSAVGRPTVSTFSCQGRQVIGCCAVVTPRAGRLFRPSFLPKICGNFRPNERFSGSKERSICSHSRRLCTSICSKSSTQYTSILTTHVRGAVWA